MVEVLLGVDYAQGVVFAYRGGVTVDGGGGQGIGAGIDDQGFVFADDEASVDHGRKLVGEARDGVAAVGESHAR